MRQKIEYMRQHPSSFVETYRIVEVFLSMPDNIWEDLRRDIDKKGRFAPP